MRARRDLGEDERCRQEVGAGAECVQEAQGEPERCQTGQEREPGVGEQADRDERAERDDEESRPTELAEVLDVGEERARPKAEDELGRAERAGQREGVQKFVERNEEHQSEEAGQAGEGNRQRAIG